MINEINFDFIAHIFDFATLFRTQNFRTLIMTFKKTVWCGRLHIITTFIIYDNILMRIHLYSQKCLNSCPKTLVTHYICNKHNDI